MVSCGFNGRSPSLKEVVTSNSTGAGKQGLLRAKEASDRESLRGSVVDSLLVRKQLSRVVESCLAQQSFLSRSSDPNTGTGALSL